MALFNGVKVQASSSITKKKANSSHAGISLPAQPEGVYLDVLDPSLKEPRTEMGVSAG